MRAVASAWCHSKGQVNLTPFLASTSPYVLVDEYKTPFVDSLRSLLLDPRVSTLYTTNVVVRTFLTSAAEFDDERTAKQDKQGYIYVDSRTVRVREDIKLSFLTRVRKIVNPVTFFAVHVSDHVRWKFEYAAIAGVRDKMAVSVAELHDMLKTETTKLASPPRQEDDDENE